MTVYCWTVWPSGGIWLLVVLPSLGIWLLIVWQLAVWPSDRTWLAYCLADWPSDGIWVSLTRWWYMIAYCLAVWPNDDIWVVIVWQSDQVMADDSLWLDSLTKWWFMIAYCLRFWPGCFIRDNCGWLLTVDWQPDQVIVHCLSLHTLVPAVWVDATSNLQAQKSVSLSVVNDSTNQATWKVGKKPKRKQKGNLKNPGMTWPRGRSEQGARFFLHLFWGRSEQGPQKET